MIPNTRRFDDQYGIPRPAPSDAERALLRWCADNDHTMRIDTTASGSTVSVEHRRTGTLSVFGAGRRADAIHLAEEWMHEHET